MKCLATKQRFSGEIVCRQRGRALQELFLNQTTVTPEQDCKAEQYHNIAEQEADKTLKPETMVASRSSSGCRSMEHPRNILKDLGRCR